MQAHIQKLTLEIEHGRMIIQPPNKILIIC